MNKLFPTKAVIFDMDGVLVDSESLWDESVIESLVSYGVDYEELQRQYNLSMTGLRIDNVVELFCRLLPDKNIPEQEMLDSIIEEAIRKITLTKPILPGVIESLTLCRELGLKVGLASSSPKRVIDNVTDCLDISQYLDIRVSAETLPHGKPHPEVYLLAAEKIAESPLQCVSIEDSLPGMIAAKAARMTSIVIPANTERKRPQWCLADHQLTSLLELTAMHLK